MTREGKSICACRLTAAALGYGVNFQTLPMKKQRLVRGTGVNVRVATKGALSVVSPAEDREELLFSSSWGDLPASLLRWLVNRSGVHQPSERQPQSPPLSRCIAKTPDGKVNCEHRSQKKISCHYSSKQSSHVWRDLRSSLFLLLSVLRAALG